MKKIKTINELISSLILLNPLSSIGFNSQCQSNQITTIKNNNSFGNYFVKNIAPVQMGEIWVTVDESDPTIITGYSSGNGRLQILDYITEISNNSFQYNRNIQLLDLSNATGLTKIDQNAFRGCIGILDSIIIPSSVTSIGDWAFSYTSITSLDLSNATNLTTIDSFAFTNCSNLTGDLVIPSSVISIGDNAFSSSKITWLDLSNATSLTTIGSSTFLDCNLTENIIIPSNVTSIGTRAFSSNTNVHLLDLSNAISLTTIRENAFASCSNLTGDLVIPASVTSIGNKAFSNTNITSITIDPLNKNFSFVTNLGPNAKILVSGTDGIWKDDSISAGSLASGNIVIPSNISIISTDAFYGSNITSLDLSQATSLTTIGSSGFMYCSKLKGNLTIPSITTVIGTDAFRNTTFDNLFFISETPPTFNLSWQPTVTGKVYVPSEQAKEAYLKAENFGFNADQVEVDLPNNKSNTGLILGLIFGLGIPIILAAGFGIWHLAKKKKTTVKIKNKK